MDGCLGRRRSGSGLIRFGGRCCGRNGNAAFDHDIGRTADQDQVFDIVAAHQHDAAPRVDGGCIQHGQTRLTVAAAADERRGGAVPDDPQHQRQAAKPDDHRYGGHQEFRAVLGENVFEHEPSLLCGNVAAFEGFFQARTSVPPPLTRSRWRPVCQAARVWLATGPAYSLCIGALCFPSRAFCASLAPVNMILAMTPTRNGRIGASASEGPSEGR